MKTVGVIIPALNEEKTLNGILDLVAGLGFIHQCVVVNDGSTDGTAALLKERLARGEQKIRVITHEVNRGKGSAIRSALSAIDTDHAVIQDADTEYDPRELSALFQLLESGTADVVYGSRFLIKNPNLYRTYLWGNKFLTGAINALGNGRLTDAYTCYKAMSVDRWRSLGLKSRGFEIEAEISMKCLLARWRISDVPVHYQPRTFAEGKKIRGSDAVKGILTALKIRSSGWRPSL